MASRSHLSKETIVFIEQIKKDKGKIRLLHKGSSLKLCLVAEGKKQILTQDLRQQWSGIQPQVKQFANIQVLR